MDIPRVKSPPSILVNEFQPQHGYRSTSKPVAMPFFGSTREPVPIPNARDPVPPPRPPPRNLDIYAAGSDLGHIWANKLNGGVGKGGGAGGSVSSESSLHGNWGRRKEVDRMAERREFVRREVSVSTVKSPLDRDTKLDFSRHQDEGYYSISDTKPANYLLHGARPLEQMNLQGSSQAYDNKLLSKIGRPETPPRMLSTGSIEGSPTSWQPSYQNGKLPHPLKTLSTPDGSLSTSPDFPLRKNSFPSRLGGSPVSRPISPGLITSATSGNQFMRWRNPTWNDGSTPSPATEREQQQRRSCSSSHALRHQRSRRSGSGPTPTTLSDLDESAAGSFPCSNDPANSGNAFNTFNTGNEYTRRYKHGSYDQSVLAESDPTTSGNISEFPLEETGASALRHLHLEDQPLHRTSSYYLGSPTETFYLVPDSRPGMKKRKALSPPPRGPHDDKAPSLLVGDGSEHCHQRNTISSTAHLSANRSSPQNLFAPAHGSISSASSSSLRQGSYASSNGLSLGSSITSISSLDHLSPGGLSPACISPSSEQQFSGRDSTYVPAISSNPSPQDSLSQSQQRSQPDPQSAAAIARKMSGPSAPPKHSGAPKIQANVHICDCCPKKPKKFDTLQELRNHQSEKQYACSFCQNRFKNKNEAERHKNSLHLRRHSWSCATLASSYDAAFHTQAISLSQNPNEPPPMDMIPPVICGYCGTEFSNNPADWTARINHLTNTHKFGECNQSKKFFRADHFRQHLKHSHAGTSGKWTNMLENACMKDEPSPITGSEGMQQPGAPIANMGMIPGHGLQMNAMNMGLPGMGLGKNERIDEMSQEM